MRILTRRKLFSFALFLGGGMAMAHILKPNTRVLLAAAIVVLAIALFFQLRRAKRRFFAGAALVLYFLSVFFAGAGYYAARDEARPDLDTAYGTSFAGTIAGNPYIDEDGARFVCTLTDVYINGEASRYRFRLYLRGDEKTLDAIACGQSIAGVGHLFAPDAATNPHAFDFGAYLWRAGMAGYVTANAGDVAFSGAGGGLSNFLYTARKALSARVYAAFTDNPEIVMALVLGDTRDLDTDLRAQFSRSGVAHLLAVSGLHISLVAAALSLLLAHATGVRAATYLSLAGIVLYAAIVGFRPSVVRAVIMYAVLCGASLTGRASDGSTRLALAFCAVLLINPLRLVDAGFVLSFSACAGLIWIAPPLMKLVRADRLRDRDGFLNRVGYYFASLAVATTTAQIATFPALALFYGTVPTYAIVANLILVPYTLLTMCVSFVGIAIEAIAVVPDHMLSLLRHAVGFISSLPYGEIAVKPPNALVWLLFLACGIAVSDLSPMRNKWKPWAVLAFPALVVFCCVWVFDSGCVITFLDVGQADAAVIRVDGKTYVVDVGEDGSEVADYVTGENWTIDAVFLSHPHSDHAGGLGELTQACDVDTVYVPAGWFDQAKNASIRAESTAVMDAGIEWTELSPGDEVRLSARARMTALESGAATDDAINDMSLILLLDYGDAEALFTGDADVETGPDIDVLKVGHHGARDATDEALIAALTPEVAVISVGDDNPYGHPDARVIAMIEEAGADAYRTDEAGAVTVTMDADGDLRVETFIKEGGK